MSSNLLLTDLLRKIIIIFALKIKLSEIFLIITDFVVRERPSVTWSNISNQTCQHGTVIINILRVGVWFKLQVSNPTDSSSDLLNLTPGMCKVTIIWNLQTESIVLPDWNLRQSPRFFFKYSSWYCEHFEHILGGGRRGCQSRGRWASLLALPSMVLGRGRLPTTTCPSIYLLFPLYLRRTWKAFRTGTLTDLLHPRKPYLAAVHVLRFSFFYLTLLSSGSHNLVGG